MAPSPLTSRTSTSQVGNDEDPTVENYSRSQIVIEAWAQGFNFGALIILVLFVLCNYRRGIVLHKLILLELLLALGHGIFIFFQDPTFGWVISTTATLLYMSYTLHNVIAWLKIRPFLPSWGGRFFIYSLLAVQPYWVLETYANFQYFNLLGGKIFELSRYFEPLARDPWWVFTTIKLVLVINKNYEYTVIKLIRTSPRFGIMLLCMFASVVFITTDVIALGIISTQSGINPFWRLALVFKCASDTIFLDDFKSVLDHISESAIRRATHIYASGANDGTSHKPRQGSVPLPPMTQGSIVTISADNTSGQHGGSTQTSGEKRKRSWGVSRFTAGYHTRDSTEQRILDSEGPMGEGQPRIRAETTITVSKQQQHQQQRQEHGPSSSHHESSSSTSVDEASSGEQAMPLQDGDLSAPMTYDWVDGPAQVHPAVARGQDDLERGIPMRPLRERRIGFD